MGSAPARRLRGGWLRKRSLSLSGHRTSVALEPEFWAVLERLAQDGSLSLAELVERVDGARDPSQPLASVLRLTALRGVAYPGGGGGSSSDESQKED